jgi:hypothetical protein
MIKDINQRFLRRNALSGVIVHVTAGHLTNSDTCLAEPLYSLGLGLGADTDGNLTGTQIGVPDIAPDFLLYL